MQVDLAENDDDSAPVTTFKKSMADSLRERFAMTSLATAKHPFMVATVLDPAMKSMADFPDDIRAAAYDQVRSLVTAAETTVADSAAEDEAEEPPTKRAREDVRSATMSFLARRVQTTQASPSEFERYLGVTSTPESDLLSWWKEHQDVYPNCASVARRYHVIPASSAASERLFSATGRLVDKKRSRLLPERVESLVFLNRNK